MIDAVREVAGHFLRRVGTAFSAVLVTSDVPPELVSQLVVALGAVAGVTFDIGLAVFYRKRLKIAAKQLAKRELLQGEA